MYPSFNPSGLYVEFIIPVKWVQPSKAFLLSIHTWFFCDINNLTKLKQCRNASSSILVTYGKITSVNSLLFPNPPLWTLFTCGNEIFFKDQQS